MTSLGLGLEKSFVYNTNLYCL